jgi:hypothetical protein
VSTNPRTRNTVAVLCIALVVFAAFVPATAADVALAVLVPLWLVIPAVVVTIVRRRASRCDDQPVALLSLVLFRAPPPHALSLA